MKNKKLKKVKSQIEMLVTEMRILEDHLYAFAQFEDVEFFYNAHGELEARHVDINESFPDRTLPSQGVPVVLTYDPEHDR